MISRGAIRDLLASQTRSVKEGKEGKSERVRKDHERTQKKRMENKKTIVQCNQSVERVKTVNESFEEKNVDACSAIKVLKEVKTVNECFEEKMSRTRSLK